VIGKKEFAAVYLLLFTVGLYLQLHRDVGVPMKKSFDNFPAVVSQWRMTGESQLSDRVQAILKASDVLMRQYQNQKGETVQLYIGYHDGGQGSGEIHSPKHCLPGNGWQEVSSSRSEMPLAGGKVNLVKAVYQKGDNRELFLYWYQVRDKSLSEEVSLKLAEITNSLLYRRRDASFIRISIPFQGDERKAVAVGERFVGDFLPAIHDFLPS
jgi:EpsI family protein